jgi:hypothetical protein
MSEWDENYFQTQQQPLEYESTLESLLSRSDDCGLSIGDTLYDLLSCLSFIKDNTFANNKRNLLPAPRAGKRSDGIVPMMRTGRSSDAVGVVPMMRVGRSSWSDSEDKGLGVLPMPRTGRSDAVGVLPMMRTGRSDASGIVPMMRTGRSSPSSGMLPMPRAGRRSEGDATGLLPIPRAGRSVNVHSKA